MDINHIINGEINLKPETGFACSSSDAKFYICSNDNINNTFVGCCATNPCEKDAGCGRKDLRDATYSGPVVDGQPFPMPACFNKAQQITPSLWHNCKIESPVANAQQYIGCCADHQCVKLDCYPDSRGSAKFSDVSNLVSFVNLFGSPPVSPGPSLAPSSSPTSNASPAATSTGASTNQSVASGGSSAPTKVPQTSQVPSGTAAGIAIGCTVAGVLLGTLVAFFLLRRRKHRNPQPAQVHMSYAPGKGEDIASSMARGDDMQLGQFLLNPKPDNEIVSDLRSLDALIRQHVENNYHLHPVQQSPKSLAQALTTLGLSSHGQRSPDDIARLAIDARTRVAALQHVIIRVALQSTALSPGSRALVSMLPPSVVAFMHSAPVTERHRGNAEAMSTAITKWRQLSAFLLHPNRSDRTPLPPSEEDTAQQAQQLAKELNRFLEPFVVRGRELNYGQESHLGQVLVECARFGYLLFSQPAEYRLNYEGHGRRGGVVVCPGLERVSDGEGRQFSKPQVLSAPVEDP